MKHYDPEIPVFSLHVPKCGGQSMRRILEEWFGPKFRIHYFQQFNALPPRHELEPGLCVHGHFNREKGFGVKTYYPQADQFIAIFRDPLEMALSNYFFWKRKERRRRIKLNILTPGDPDDYTGLDDFFRKRPGARIMEFMPEDMNKSNYRDYLDRHFVWVGVMDTLDRDMNVLARRLGVRRAVKPPHINSSPRDETLSPALESEFRERNRWLFELVDYVRDKNARENQ